jgi:hypothetical protein
LAWIQIRMKIDVFVYHDRGLGRRWTRRVLIKHGVRGVQIAQGVVWGEGEGDS